MFKPDSTRPVTLLIDGGSGAGKTSLAKYISDRWQKSRRLVVLHMDDLYQGWSGLAEATLFVQSVVIPARAAGEPVRWQRYDWAQDRLAEWNEIPASVDLLIEGCGCLTSDSASVADMSIWINADDDVRKRLALERGDEDFDAHWYEWEAQFALFRAEHTPERHASLVVRATR